MYYYIYKITNINNQKFYIGSHKTEDLNDGYFGSGVYLNRAITRYGRESFIKENILYCSNEQEMFQKETEYLTLYKKDKVYNLKFCALGGNTREKYTKKQKQTYIQKLIDNPNCPIGKKGLRAFNYGKRLAKETKQKQSSSHKKRFIKLKANAKEWSIWRRKYIPHALENQKLMTEINSKPVRLTRLDTGEVLTFKSKADCAHYLNITSISALTKYALGKFKNRSKSYDILKQYRLEFIKAVENK
jgi:hypothetical protein